MNNKSLVKISNTIGIVSIILLVYWVFIFISIDVFGFKVFRENITDTFYLSIVGILALMFGSLIINIMFNLTRIAEKHNQDNIQTAKSASRKFGLIIVLSFPLIFGLLFVGDYLTARKKEKMLISSAKSIIDSNTEKMDKLSEYTFTKEWIKQTSDILTVYAKTDTYFPDIDVIIADTFDNSDVYLAFSESESYHWHLDDTIQLYKKDFIRQTTKEERDYLFKVFYENLDEVRFSANNGKYELFFPYIKGKKKIVLYFSDYQRYGKIGS